MREEKRRRLEARGWRIGTVQEFLHLSLEEAAYLDLKDLLIRSLLILGTSRQELSRLISARSPVPAA